MAKGDAALLDGIACGEGAGARFHGSDGATNGMLLEPGNALDRHTGRRYFLDYPCDLGADEPVTVILNLHGGGSIANWQRHYFPASDYVSSHRLVVATPTAATVAELFPGSGPVRFWEGGADDAHLQNIVEFVFAAFGADRIRSFWLAGHSQGGFTSRRLLDQTWWRDRVDGWLSLSGGRIGAAPFVERFGPPAPDGSPPPAGRVPRRMAEFGEIGGLSHIFAIGEYEIEGLPETSPLAQDLGAGPRERMADVVDTEAGHVWDYGRAGYNVWGRVAAPGTAQVFTYPGCRDGMVVADVLRIDKGHTEGLEPQVTRSIIDMIVQASGGRARSIT